MREGLCDANNWVSKILCCSSKTSWPYGREISSIGWTAVAVIPLKCKISHPSP